MTPSRSKAQAAVPEGRCGQHREVAQDGLPFLIAGPGSRFGPVQQDEGPVHVAQAHLVVVVRWAERLQPRGVLRRGGDDDVLGRLGQRQVVGEGQVGLAQAVAAPAPAQLQQRMVFGQFGVLPVTEPPALHKKPE